MQKEETRSSETLVNMCPLDYKAPSIRLHWKFTPEWMRLKRIPKKEDGML
jgi:hypothetical protein